MVAQRKGAGLEAVVETDGGLLERLGVRLIPGETHACPMCGGKEGETFDWQDFVIRGCSYCGTRWAFPPGSASADLPPPPLPAFVAELKASALELQHYVRCDHPDLEMILHFWRVLNSRVEERDLRIPMAYREAMLVAATGSTLAELVVMEGV